MSLTRLGVLLCSAALLLALFSPRTQACHIAKKWIRFPGLGLHTAYYCKATAEEKRRALELVRQNECVQAKLEEFDKTILSAEATDSVPYHFTPEEAAAAGPIVECRLTLVDRSSEEAIVRAGFLVIATGEKLHLATTRGTRGALVGVRFSLGAPAIFEKVCRNDECYNNYRPLCGGDGGGSRSDAGSFERGGPGNQP